jgi:hypothetical protein
MIIFGWLWCWQFWHSAAQKTLQWICTIVKTSWLMWLDSVYTELQNVSVCNFKCKLANRVPLVIKLKWSVSYVRASKSALNCCRDGFKPGIVTVKSSWRLWTNRFMICGSKRSQHVRKLMLPFQQEHVYVTLTSRGFLSAKNSYFHRLKVSLGIRSVCCVRFSVICYESWE